MKIFEKINDEVEEELKSGKIGIIPTDTIYGIVASVYKKEGVEKIYALRQRDLQKPCIILIASLEDLNIFGIELSEEEKNKLLELWPGKVSVILPCLDKNNYYLHRGKNSLAFRWPAKPDLEALLKKTGPLVAPSANISGFSPAKNIKEAQSYFGETVDFYVDQGELHSQPSTIVFLEKGQLRVKREGELISVQKIFEVTN